MAETDGGIMNKLRTQKVFMEEAKRLSKFMESVDVDLKKMSDALNANFQIISKNFRELDARLKRIEEHLK
jgi:hypothetical protein